MRKYLNNVVYGCTSDLFADSFPGAQLEVIELEGEHISDALTKNFISTIQYELEWQNPQNIFRAMLLVAQTGKGKNFWVLHTLRDYAAHQGRKVLYLCNRKALSNQQIQEARKAVDPTRKETVQNATSEYEIGSITIMTYHKFYENFCEKGEDYFKGFSFCVIDEAHFFYSDALFNPDTERILKLIPEVFADCYRIYMTATPDAVVDLIYAAEWEALKGDYAPQNCAASYSPELGLRHKESLPKMRVYRFPYNYSAFQNICVFSKAENLIKEILCDETAGKWVVFVTSKDKGREMKQSLKDGNMKVAYIDRETRSCSDISVRQEWERIQVTGNLGNNKVLITTSVLDNGFSIHDKAVANIVLFAEDKTEFLQELGRVRLEQGQMVKVYFSRMTKNGRLHPNNRKSVLNVFAKYYGSRQIAEYPYPDAEITASPISVLKWKMSSNDDMGYVGTETVKAKNGKIAMQPYINNFARWVAKKMADDLEEYEKLMAGNEDLAPILFKVRWLTSNPDELHFGNLKYTDIDLPYDRRRLDDVNAFFEPYLEVVLKEHGKEEEDNEKTKKFEEFSREFQKLFAGLKPNDSSINLGKNRGVWKHKAINSHLVELQQLISDLPGYILEEGNEKNEWILRRGKS